MEATPSHLFVYGTLMAAAGGPLGRSQRQRLQRQADSLGAATTLGRLYDLGRYPALVPSEDPADIVHGEVYLLRDPAHSLRWLDDYEGIIPGDHDDNEYIRARRAVRLAGGQALSAWVYLYTGDCSTARLLSQGRWPGD